MPETSTGSVAAALAEIRDRGYVRHDDVPRLLTALEAALKLADDWAAAGPPPRPADEIQRRKCAVELREAIARELLAKEKPDAR